MLYKNEKPAEASDSLGGCSAEIAEVLEQAPQDCDEEHPPQAFEVSQDPCRARVSVDCVLGRSVPNNVDNQNDNSRRDECRQLAVSQKDKACLHD